MFDGLEDEAAAIPEPPAPAIDEHGPREIAPRERGDRLLHERPSAGRPPTGDQAPLQRDAATVGTGPIANRANWPSRIVTRAEHRVSKNGKPFGSMSLEDHHGSHDFMLFGEDYLKFKHYLVPGTLLFVKARRYRAHLETATGQLELKVSVDLLERRAGEIFTIARIPAAGQTVEPPLRNCSPAP